MEMLNNFVRVSRNAKTGPIPGVYVHEDTCPDACPLKNNGCYAATGPTRKAWKLADKPFQELLTKIRALPRGTVWRYGVAGDLPGYRDAIDGHLLDALIQAAQETTPIVYTHKPIFPGPHVPAKVAYWNRKYIELAVKAGFIINLSANNPIHADLLADAQIAPVVTMLAKEYERDARRRRSQETPDAWCESISEWRARTTHLPTHTPAGQRIAVCPATYSDITCAQCGACARLRKAVIGFPAHGAQANRANRIAVGSQPLAA
jgi:hypothetical protein